MADCGRSGEAEIMFAIRNKKTKKWVYGTDHRYWPYRQRTSFEQAMTFPDRETAEFTAHIRRCSKDYEVVEVELKEVRQQS